MVRRAYFAVKFALLVALAAVGLIANAAHPPNCGGQWMINGGQIVEWGQPVVACDGYAAFIANYGWNVSSCVATEFQFSTALSAKDGSGNTAGEVISRYDCTPAPEEPAVPTTLDWTNQSHVTQGLIVAICAVLFAMGYRAGDKL